MKLLVLISNLIFLISLVNCKEKARFDNYRLYEVKIANENHLSLFQQILDYPDGIKFLSSPSIIVGSTIHLIVPPHKFGDWSELDEKFEFNPVLISSNYQELVELEELRFNRRKSIDWSSFWPLDEIYNWMQELANSRPADISIFQVGTSYEGRQIRGLRVNIGGGSGKKSIFFESNIHANEWIGASTTTFIMNQLLTSTNATIVNLLNHYDWYFVPVLNVDGYVYTWEVDRTWRKTRRPTRNLLCNGADPNRNFDVNWSQYGSSNNPCTTGYHGDFVFSEPETKALSEFITTVPNLFGYISFHSYGRLLMTPYAFSNNATANLPLINEIGQAAVDAIKPIRDIDYELGKISDFFGLIAGSSVDYITLNQQPELIYCYELSDNHILPNAEIQLTGQELFASVSTIFLQAISRGLA